MHLKKITFQSEVSVDRATPGEERDEMMMNDSDQKDDLMDNVVFDLKLELAGLV